MKNLKLKKIVAVALVAMTVATVSPIGASAAWKQNSTGWWNTEGDSWSTGWRNIDSTWYNFGSDGYMKTGWAKDNGTWYYFNTVSDGTKGAMKTGWVKDNGTWYYLNPVSDGTKGAMKTGWINDNGVWYFAASSGAMQTGVVQVNGKVYYLAASGAMATGSVTIDGVVYTFATTGEAIGDKIPTPTLGFNTDGTSVAVKAVDTTTSTSSDSHHSSGGGGSTTTPTTPTDATQAAIDNKYAAEAKIPAITAVANADGITSTVDIAAVLPATFKAELGQPAKEETIDGVKYLVTKDITISINDGTDVGITQTALGKYNVDKGVSGTVTAVISLLNTSTGELRYVSTESTPFTS
jgi:hypothetical protein